jgi:hypothetical protein
MGIGVKVNISISATSIARSSASVLGAWFSTGAAAAAAVVVGEGVAEEPEPTTTCPSDDDGESEVDSDEFTLEADQSTDREAQTCDDDVGTPRSPLKPMPVKAQEDAARRRADVMGEWAAAALRPTTRTRSITPRTEREDKKKVKKKLFFFFFASTACMSSREMKETVDSFYTPLYFHPARVTLQPGPRLTQTKSKGGG